VAENSAALSSDPDRVRVGRPTKFTVDRQERILDVLRDGVYLETAARLGGISYETLNEWRKRFPEFAEAVEGARAEAEATMISRVRSASVDHWQAAAWWLERSFPSRWGRRDATAEARRAAQAAEPGPAYEVYRWPTPERARVLLELRAQELELAPPELGDDAGALEVNASEATPAR
jgi:hypothetical protein